MSEESVKNEMGSLEDVLGMMNRVNETFAYEVWVPSLKKNVMFRELNTSQQKRLIKSIIDSPIYNTEFIFTLRKIVEENCVDSTIDINRLTILDKLMIAMKMRSVSVGDTIEFEIPTGKDKQSLKRGVSLEKIINEVKSSLVIPDNETISDDNGIYTIICSIPSIGTEYKLEDELRKNSPTKDIKDYDELRRTIGDAFIGEVVKYIKEISIKENDKTTKINLEDVSFRNRITLVEQLPEKITKRVLDYIQIVKEEIDKITVVKLNVGTKEEPEIKEEKLAIDGSFFTSS